MTSRFYCIHKDCIYLLIENQKSMCADEQKFSLYKLKISHYTVNEIWKNISDKDA
jgi:hypothetical protein